MLLANVLWKLTEANAERKAGQIGLPGIGRSVDVDTALEYSLGLRKLSATHR